MDKYICKYCQKICTSRNSLRQHEIRCKQNPNKIDTSKCWGNGTRPVWNKGLNKETDERIKRQGIAIHNVFVKNGGTFKNRKHSNETIIKLKNNPNCGGLRIGSGRSKKGWYKGFYCRSTYELVYIIYNLDHDILFSSCKRIYEYEYKGEKHKYYPDFELEDGTIVEIKGYANEQTLAKLDSVKDRKLIVLYYKDLNYAFDYVKSMYDYDKLEDLYEI